MADAGCFALLDPIIALLHFQFALIARFLHRTDIRISTTSVCPMPESSDASSSPSSSSLVHHAKRNTAALRALNLYHCPGIDEYDDDETVQDNKVFMDYFKDLYLQHRKLLMLIETAQDLSLSFMDPDCHVSTHVTVLLEKTTDDVFFILQKSQKMVDELETLKTTEEHNILHRTSQLSHLNQAYNDAHFVIMRLLKHGGGKKGHGAGRSSQLLKNQALAEILSSSIEAFDITNEKAEEFQEAVALASASADNAHKTCKDINHLWKEAGKCTNGKSIDETLLQDYAKDLRARKNFDSVLKESEQYYNETMQRDAEEVLGSSS